MNLIFLSLVDRGINQTFYAQFSPFIGWFLDYSASVDSCFVNIAFMYMSFITENS